MLLGGQCFDTTQSGCTLRQRIEQRLSLLEIGGVRALSKPTVYRSEDLVRLTPLAGPTV